jgi:hypothetical protein
VGRCCGMTPECGATLRAWVLGRTTEAPV